MDTGEDAAAAAARRSTVVCDHWKSLRRLGEPFLPVVGTGLKAEDRLEPLPGDVLCPLGNELCGFVKTEWWSAFATEGKHRDILGQEMTGGEIIGHVICPFDNEHFIVDASCGPRYCRSDVDKEELTPGTRVVLDMTTLTILRTAPMTEEEHVVLMRQMRELLELPLRHPELFRLIGVKPPGVNPTDVASILFGELHPPSLLKSDRHPKRRYREMPPRHHRTKTDRRWQWQR